MSTRIYLTIDFGSTYTKLTAIDLDKEEIIATSKAMTTVKTDVLIGFNEAFKILENELKNKLGKFEIIKKVAWLILFNFYSKIWNVTHLFLNLIDKIYRRKVEK